MNHIDPMSDSILHQHTIRIFEAAVSAVQPQVLLQNYLTCTDATGAIIDANTIAQSEWVDIESALQQHDSYHFFKKIKGYFKQE